MQDSVAFIRQHGYGIVPNVFQPASLQLRMSCRRFDRNKWAAAGDSVRAPLWVLTDQQIQQCAAASSGIVCVVSAGGVIAMRPLILHASSKSESDLPRRVLHIEYASSRCIRDGFELALV